MVKNVSRIRKILIIVLSSFFISGLCTVICFDQYYFAFLSRNPEPKSGRIYRIVVSHGSVRYGTKEEWVRIHRVEQFALIGAAGMFIAGILILQYRDFSLKPRAQNKGASPAHLLRSRTGDLQTIVFMAK